MSKKVKLGFFTIKAIHRTKKEQERNLKKFFQDIENKPLNINEKNHRYVELSPDIFGTISSLHFDSNGIFLKLRKCRPKNIHGSFLGEGERNYDVAEELNNHFGRKDSTTIEESFVKIFNDDVAIIQLHKNAITPNQLRYLLEEYFKDYFFEIFPIYRDDLFEEIRNGRVKHLNVKVGFSPHGSKFDPNYYKGIADIEISFKKKRGLGRFLDPQFVIDILTKRTTQGLGKIDEGAVTSGKVGLDGQDNMIKLDCYQLQEHVPITPNKTFEEVCTNSLFDNLRNEHHAFLSNYLKRDTRY